ncbi:MAG: hypothetical protein WC436_04190 [Candidatus Babeliales bacterium]
MKNLKFLLIFLGFFGFLNLTAMEEAYVDEIMNKDDLEIMALTGGKEIAALLQDLDIGNVSSSNVTLITNDDFILEISTNVALEKKLITENQITSNGIIYLSINKSELEQKTQAKRNRESKLGRSSSKKNRESNPDGE